jgi:hypothetical protein
MRCSMISSGRNRLKGSGSMLSAATHACPKNFTTFPGLLVSEGKPNKLEVRPKIKFFLRLVVVSDFNGTGHAPAE